MFKHLIKHLARGAARASGVSHRLDEISASLNRPDRGLQVLLALKYRELAARGILCSLDDVEFKSYSQNGEDGILWYIFSLIGAKRKNCVEICAGDGQQCNTANLIINHGWTGILFDGNESNVESGREFFGCHPDTRTYPPKFVCAWITAENVNELIRVHEYAGEIDLLSLDIDGVDYWIWNAIEVVSPRVVVAEVQMIWGDQRSVTVPYDPDFRAEFWGPFGIYCGASLPAFVKLARKKGYRLVGCQRYGYNAFFLRNDVGEEMFPEIAPDGCFQHPFAKWASQELRPKILDREWVEV